jgi:FkbH-like protein
MHETVIYQCDSSDVQIPDKVLNLMRRNAQRVALRSSLLWAEHCTECVWPSCYSTCALYTPRSDLKCRRFLRGIQRVRCIGYDRSNVNCIAVSFRQWGKIEAEGRIRFSEVGARRVQERIDELIAKAIDGLPAPLGVKVDIAKGWNKGKRAAWVGRIPISAVDKFVIECYSETIEPVHFCLRISPADGLQTGYFEKHFTLKQGYSFLTFDATCIAELVDLTQTVRVRVEPLDQPPGNSFIFSTLDFVRMKPADELAQMSMESVEPANVSETLRDLRPKVKCVIWDLDNTIWKGALAEDGIDGIELYPEVKKTIVELDRRGIIQSIASKNDREQACAVLKRFDLMEYFVYPQIHWYPKSQSVAEIARLLNVSTDTFVFVDDQAFEREEVISINRDVRVVDTGGLKDLLLQADFDVPVTEESARRRILYKEEEQRQLAFNNTHGNFINFLRMCDLTVSVSDLGVGTLDRAFELVERTNQLNYRGRRLPKRELQDILNSQDSRRGLVLSCHDRFGDYGIIGFAVVDLSNWMMVDFFMSCRVQRKKVEHALVSFLDLVAAKQGARIKIRYKPSKRNDPALETLGEMGCECIERIDDEQVMIPRERIEYSDVVKIHDRSTALHETGKYGAVDGVNISGWHEPVSQSYK